ALGPHARSGPGDRARSTVTVSARAARAGRSGGPRLAGRGARVRDEHAIARPARAGFPARRSRARPAALRGTEPRPGGAAPGRVPPDPTTDPRGDRRPLCPGE